MPSGGGGGAPASTNTVQQTVPDWLKGPIMANIDTATAQSQAPYTAYQGQRIAPLNASQNQAAALTQNGIGAYSPELQAGMANTAAASQPFNQATFDQYNDPYKAQVTDEIARLGNRNFTENVMPAVNSQFTGNGMFGSSRNAEILGNKARDAQADITGKQAEYLSSGFQKSLDNMNTGLGRQLTAGAQEGQMATTGQAMNNADVAALQSIGGQQQTNQQQLFDTGYNTFLEQQQYPEAQSAFLSSIIHGSTPANVINASKQSIADPASQATSLAGTITNALSANKGAGLAKGGLVKAKRAKSKKANMPIGLGSMSYA